MKITIEQGDIENLIKEKYPGSEIISDTLEGIEVVIRVAEIKTVPHNIQGPRPTIIEPKKNEVRLESGIIDAEKSGLTLKNREVTIPGHSMGKIRNALPRF